MRRWLGKAAPQGVHEGGDGNGDAGARTDRRSGTTIRATGASISTRNTARGKDLWFHVQKAPGSHVVVMSRGEDIPDTTRQEAAELAVQAEKDGTARLNAVISGAQERMREAKRQAGKQAAAFETDLNSKTAAQCRALEQAAASRSGAAAAMIVERIWDSEWQS